jgi:hypothetical protein
MNKKILGVFVALSVIAVMSSPVMALGPTNPNAVEKNQHLNAYVIAYQLTPPSGMINEWLFLGMYENHNMVKDCNAWNIGGAITLNSWMEAWSHENRWMYFDSVVLYDFFYYTTLGQTGDPTLAEAKADMMLGYFPNGYYMKISAVHEP